MYVLENCILKDKLVVL